MKRKPQAAEPFRLKVSMVQYLVLLFSISLDVHYYFLFNDFVLDLLNPLIIFRVHVFMYD